VRRLNMLFSLSLVLCLSLALQADVIIKHRSSIETGGGMMSMDVDGTEYIKTDMSYMGGKVTMKGGMAAMMAGMAPTEFVQITRLDKGVMWELNAKSKSYTETDLKSMKEMVTKTSGSGMGDDIDQSKYEWNVEVTASGSKTDINGFKCKNVKGIANGVHKEDPEDKVRLTYEYWYADDTPGYDELVNHNKRFSEATGIDMLKTQQSAQKIFCQYGPQFDEMNEKMKDAKGISIKTVIMVEGTKGQGMGGEMGKTKMPEGMKEMFGGKQGKEQEKSEEGMSKVFSLTTEILSIEKKGVDDSKFEIPEGYSKQ
jgi:hypothetical protein